MARLFSLKRSRSWRARASAGTRRNSIGHEGALAAARAPARLAEADACFRNAIKVARSQGARLFELRAATALARLQGDRKKRSRRKARLSSIYQSFTEGFDMPDLKDARALLEEFPS